MSADKLILMGRIGAAHGIRGEVRIKSHTDDPLAISAYGPLVTKKGESIHILKSRLQKDMVIATLRGIADRTAAERLNGVDLYVPRDQLEIATDEDEFLQADLIGLETRLADGAQHGTIIAIDNYGAGDVLSVKLSDGRIELFPFTLAIVPHVDVAQGYVTIVPPDEVVVEGEAQ